MRFIAGFLTAGLIFWMAISAGLYFPVEDIDDLMRFARQVGFDEGFDAGIAEGCQLPYVRPPYYEIDNHWREI